MKTARGFFIFCYGLFSISAQTLLFREFITSFESNDIAIGIFFATWFFWVGAGALLISKSPLVSRIFQRHMPLALLAYLPAFVLEYLLILHARDLANVAPYELFPIGLILFWSLVVNAPVSLITGLLFPVLCQWIQPKDILPVSKVYILESAGSFAGGLGVTLLLAFAYPAVSIFCLLSCVLLLSILLVSLTESARRKAVLIGILLAGFGSCLVSGMDRQTSLYLQRLKWARILPADAFEGAFQTPQAEYLYGQYQGQWIAMSEGSVCQALPDPESGGRIAAITLCQVPTAENVLVIGSGLEVCRAFLKLEQIQTCTWATSDPHYALKINSLLPEELRIQDKRFSILTQDTRTFVKEKREVYDLIIIHLPEAASSVLNRYYTLEFYRQAKHLLTPQGVLAVRIPGGENILGTELVSLGASVLTTLEEVFPHLVLTPGEETWFLASDSRTLTGSPGLLKDRFASIPRSSVVFPAEGILSIYLSDRAEKAIQIYQNAPLPERLRLNTDARPLSNLYSLLLAAKQSGSPAVVLFKRLAATGMILFMIPILVFAVLRVVYVWTTPGKGSPALFDSAFLVFSAGFTGIGTVIIMMYGYQTRFGTLYLHIGILSSVFMLGLVVGAVLTRFLQTRFHPRGHLIFLLFLLFHILLLTTAAFRPIEQWTQLPFAAAFLLLGFCTGTYFPEAASRLEACRIDIQHIGSRLETADHLGAMSGAFLTGLVLVPVLGIREAILLLICFLACNPLFAFLEKFSPKWTGFFSAPAYAVRKPGYVLFGIVLCLVFGVSLLNRASPPPDSRLPESMVIRLAGDLQPVRKTATTPHGKTSVYYQLTAPDGRPTGYIFSTEDFAPEIRGYGGKLAFAVQTDPEGKLINFQLLQSNESPAYYAMLSGWLGTLTGNNLFRADGFARVQTVTGATISSKAVLDALHISGIRFAAAIGEGALPAGTLSEERPFRLPLPAIYLLAAALLTLLISRFGNFRFRLFLLAANVTLGGILFNVQYSGEQVLNLLRGNIPAWDCAAALLLLIGIPVFIIIFGNYYCGYLCPFGALQEILGNLIPPRFRIRPRASAVRWPRFLKYAVLFVLLCVFFLSGRRQVLQADPLIRIFSGTFDAILLILAGIALFGSLFYVRFWCRYCCPAGAFLSLLNGVALLKRWMPQKIYSACPLGVSKASDLDCICCDKCRFEKTGSGLTPSSLRLRIQQIMYRTAIIPAVCVALLLSILILKNSFPAAAVERTLQVQPVSGGQVRQVDMEKIKTMIEKNQLSEKEADYYQPIKDKE